MIKFRKQSDSMDCGVACLTMIMSWFEKQPDVNQIEMLCSLDRSGVSLLGLSKAAENLGFKTVGGRLSFNTLAHEVPLPCIVHWNQNHFVVIYKILKSATS